MRASLIKIPNYKVVLPSVAINLLLIAFAFLLQSRLPPVIPIYYGLPRGVEQLGPSSALALPSLTALAVTFICLGMMLFIKDKFLQNVLSGVVILATLLASIAFLKIVSIVGYL